MRTDTLETLLRRLQEERSFSGTVLITRAGRTVFEEHYGQADRAAGVPVGSRTRFALGSVTKIFTATAVLTLVEEGALRLDTRVRELLPPDRRPSTLREDVTVGHLLTHTSGIADYFEEETATGEWVSEFAALWRDRPVYRMLRPADFLEFFGDLPPYRAPGVRYQYSNAGYILLGLAVEQVTGRDCNEEVIARVFDPAGMDASGFFGSDEVRPDVATGYLRPRAPGEPWRTNVFAVPSVGGPDGGAFSTAADLDRFLSAYAAGELVKPALLTEALTPHTRMDDHSAMGHGVYLLGKGQERAFGAEGADPGAEALIRRYPELDIHTVVLSNVNDSAWTIDDCLRATVTGNAAG
ncbi:serine hydrolase [Streptomyces sp. ACA25]|uniref:serine hydrolase domain-containing protein n=1 Tax=Streptomyces sp. ACA25 TaxID=3022596 RepID=UPI002307B759|nr:serine hydrolase domain-containing protein [Streptomyces sp. ACA25]MDB1090006.1 serine hydrolase [Streptomyces sp. ACA25]